MTDNGSDEETTETTPEPSKAPDTSFTFTFDGTNAVKIAHTGNDNVGDDATKKLAVTVNDERVPVSHKGTEATYVLADEGQLKENETAIYDYPLSIGNVVTVTASPSDAVKLVWYPQHGETQAIAEYTVPEATATTEATETEDATETTEAAATAETTDA